MRSPLERSKGLHVKAQARQLMRETESFLAGDFPCVLHQRGLPVPEWAWLSMLAHAPSDELVRYADGESKGRFRGRVNAIWLGALALLAQELVMVADQTGRSIEELQHDVILAMELNWERPWTGLSSRGPSQLVEDVRQALDRFRDSSRPQ
jgi:hypothetical protein